MSQYKLKKIDEQITIIDEEFDAKVNPFMKEAKKTLNLKINDFSLDDKARAEEILEELKLKAHMKAKVGQHHTHIDMFGGQTGTRSLKDFNYETEKQHNIINVNIPVLKEGQSPILTPYLFNNNS